MITTADTSIYFTREPYPMLALKKRGIVFDTNLITYEGQSLAEFFNWCGESRIGGLFSDALEVADRVRLHSLVVAYYNLASAKEESV